MTPNTALALEGAPNFRDIGGYPAGKGKRVVSGLVFRSGNFARLTPVDLDTLRELPLRTVVDLRAPSEVQLYPSIGLEGLGVRRLYVEINPYSRGDSDSYKRLLLDDPTPAGAMKTIEATYRLLPDACGPALKVVVDCVLENCRPVVFHCSNGRDRTGLISMLLQYAVGVSRDDIVASFLESNRRINLEAAVSLSKIVFAKEYGVEFDDITLHTLNQALAPSVAVAFDTIERDHGSVEHYLASFGIDAPMLTALREKLLEEA